MEKINVEQAIRDAIPDRCKDCVTISWRISITADKVATDEPAELETVKQELVDDLNNNCRYGTRERFIGVAACRYGVLCEFPSSDLRYPDDTGIIAN